MDIPKATGKALINGNVADSKYRTRINFTSDAEYVELDSLNIETNYLNGDSLSVTAQISISSRSKVNRYEVFLDKEFQMERLVVNGVPAPKNKDQELVYNNRRSNRLISYYVANNEPLKLELTFNRDSIPDLMIYAASFNLLSNKKLKVSKRPDHQMPMPFVLNDAVIRKKTIALSNSIQVKEETTLDE